MTLSAYSIPYAALYDATTELVLDQGEHDHAPQLNRAANALTELIRAR